MHILIPNDPDGKRAEPRYARVDTGADYSIAFKSTVKELPDYGIIYDGGHTFLTASGAEMKSIGTVNLSWKIQRTRAIYHTTFHVFDDPPKGANPPNWDLLLGKDWIDGYHAYKRNSQVWGTVGALWLKPKALNMVATSA